MNNAMPQLKSTERLNQIDGISKTWSNFLKDLKVSNKTSK